MSDENLEQWISIKFCVKMGKIAIDTLALLTLAYADCAMKKSSVFNGVGSSRKDKIMCKM
jgi:hypothetical protein